MKKTPSVKNFNVKQNEDGHEESKELLHING